MVTNAPMRVPAPTTIESSPNTEPGGRPPSTAAERGEPAPGRSVAVTARPAGRFPAPVRRPPAQLAQPAWPGHTGLVTWPGHTGLVTAGRGGELAAGAVDLAAAVSRTVTGTPQASRRRTNSRWSAAGRGPLRACVGERIRLTCASWPATASEQLRRQAWSLMSLIRAYSMEKRRRWPRCNPRGGQHLGHLPPPVHRYQRVPQLVVRACRTRPGSPTGFSGEPGDGRTRPTVETVTNAARSHASGKDLSAADGASTLA